MFDKYVDKYKGLNIAVSDSAMRELMAEGKTVCDVVRVLEKGCDAPRQRTQGTIERWLNKARNAGFWFISENSIGTK